MPSIALDALDKTVNKAKSLVIVKFMFPQKKRQTINTIIKASNVLGGNTCTEQRKRRAR